MSDGTVNKPIRTSDPSPPTTGRVKEYIFDDGLQVKPYYMLEDGVPRDFDSFPEAPTDNKQYSRENGQWKRSSELYDNTGAIAIDVGAAGNIDFDSYGDIRNENNVIKYLVGFRNDGRFVQQITNSGQVKINSFDGGSKPQIVGVLDNQAEFFTYTGTLDLSPAPTTQFPKNIETPSDADIIDPVTNRFLENPIEGQIHIWRVEYTFTGKAANANLGLTFGLRNPNSGFIVTNQLTLPSGTTSSPNVDFGGGTTEIVPSSFVLVTVADTASIGIGYDLFCASTLEDANFSVTIENVTRISLEHIERD